MEISFELFSPMSYFPIRSSIRSILLGYILISPWPRPLPLSWEDGGFLTPAPAFPCSISPGCCPAEGLRRLHGAFGCVGPDTTHSPWWTTSCLSCLLHPAPAPLSSSTLSLSTFLYVPSFPFPSWGCSHLNLVTLTFHVPAEVVISSHGRVFIPPLRPHYFISDSSLTYLTIAPSV